MPAHRAPGVLGAVWLSCFIASWLIEAAGAFPVVAEGPELLRSVRDVRALSREEAARGVPVEIRAVVSYVDRARSLVFVQDETDGIPVETSQAADYEFRNLVEITGVTSTDEFRTVIVTPTFRMLGNAGPPPAKKVSLSRVQTLREDCRFIQAEGTVRRARFQDDELLLRIGASGVSVGITVPRTPDTVVDLADFVDADVTVTGVSETIALGNGRNGVIIRVPQSQFLLRNRAPDPPEAMPLWTVKGLSELSTVETPVHRVRVQGTVVSWEAGRPLLLQDDTGSAEVMMLQDPTAGPGQNIEIAGFLPFGHDPQRGVLLVEGRRVEKTHPRAPAAVTGRHADVHSGNRPAEPGPMPLLTRVADVHRLGQGEAAREYPVRVRAVVTYFDADWQQLFVEDESGGVFVEHQDETWSFEVGQKLEIEGVSGRGGFAPTIVPGRIRAVGRGSLPAGHPSTLEDLLNGQADSLFVEVRGMVRSTTLRGTHLRLVLATGRGRFRAVIPAMDEVPLPILEDSLVRIRGVCGTIMNANGQLTGIHIFVPNLDCIEIEEAGPVDPTDLPLTKVIDILRFTPFTGAGHRIRVQGTLTLQDANDGFLYLSDGEASVRVDTIQCPKLEAGDRILVIAFPVVGAPNPHLEDAVVTKLGAGPRPVAKETPATKILADGADGQLVSLSARLLGSARVEGEEILTLQSDDAVFNARLSLDGDVPPIEWPPHSLLSVTGIATVLVDEDQNPRSFRLLLRSPEDVALISFPSWLKVRHLAMFAVGLGVLIVLAFSWVWVLRKRVREQTALIRQRLEREAALEERYRQLFGNANDLIQSVGEDGRFRYVNPAWMRLLGFGDEDLDQMTHLDIVHPASREGYLAVFDEVLRGGSTGRFETVFVARDGREIIVEGSCTRESVQGRSAAAQGIFRDVTERKRAETELLLSEERFSKAFQNAPMAIGIMTLDDHCLLDVNEGFLRLWGYFRYEVIAETDRTLELWAEDEEWNRLAEEHKSRGSVHDREIRIRTKSGKICTVLLSLEDIEIGNEPCLLLIAHDVTARLNLEAQLRQAQKMESVGRLAAGVAHDFNNILTVIQGHSELLLSDPRLGPSFVGPLRQVAEAAERGADFTRQLLTFSRKQVLQRRSLALQDVIHRMKPLLARLVGENIELRFELGQARAVKADLGMIEQLLMNLIVNARDAMPAGGTITVSLEPANVSAREAARRGEQGPTSGAYTLLRVRDTGIGIEGEVLEHIFDPFFTTKEIGKGTGLGLSMVYAIIKQHAGWVDVESSPGRGTSCSVFLPTCDEEGVVDEPEAGTRAANAGTETVLVVEDEHSVRSLVRNLLSSKGYRVLEAENGVRALEIWTKRGESIDLLLSDMVMPGGLSGLDLARQFRQDRPGLRVLLTSGYSDESLGLDFSAMDGIDFMSKPYHPERLARQVRECLDADGKR